jgi:hypothetical protein
MADKTPAALLPLESAVSATVTLREAPNAPAWSA